MLSSVYVNKRHVEGCPRQHGPLSRMPVSDKLFVARVHPRYANLLLPPPPTQSFFLCFLFVFPAPRFRYVARAESNARKMNIRAARVRKKEGGRNEMESDARSRSVN